MSIDESALYGEVREQLRRQRHRLKLTQADVAARAALQRTTVANIEAGHQYPPLHVLYRVCEALGTEPKSILPSIADVSEVSFTQATFRVGDADEIAAALKGTPMTAGFVEQYLRTTEETTSSAATLYEVS